MICIRDEFDLLHFSSIPVHVDDDSFSYVVGDGLAHAITSLIFKDTFCF